METHATLDETDAALIECRRCPRVVAWSEQAPRAEAGDIWIRRT